MSEHIIFSDIDQARQAFNISVDRNHPLYNALNLVSMAREQIEEALKIASWDDAELRKLTEVLTMAYDLMAKKSHEQNDVTQAAYRVMYPEKAQS